MLSAESPFRQCQFWSLHALRTWSDVLSARNSSPDLGKTTYHNSYTPDSIQDSIPPCPAPYETYDGQDWMCTDQSELWDH